LALIIRIAAVVFKTGTQCDLYAWLVISVRCPFYMWLYKQVREFFRFISI